MTPEKRKELIDQLAGHGLIVLPTRDFDSILLQLAQLAQFERLMITALENDPLELMEVIMEEVRSQQAEPPHMMLNPDDLRPLEILDIPTIQIELYRALHDQLTKRASINPLRVPAAVAAFVGILRAEAR